MPAVRQRQRVTHFHEDFTKPIGATPVCPIEPERIILSQANAPDNIGGRGFDNGVAVGFHQLLKHERILRELAHVAPVDALLGNSTPGLQVEVRNHATELLGITRMLRCEDFLFERAAENLILEPHHVMLGCGIENAIECEWRECPL